MNGERCSYPFTVEKEFWTDMRTAASVPGNALTGYLSDRYKIHHVVIANCVFTALTCFFLWGFGTSAATLITFVLLFGLVGLSFAALWTRMIGLIARKSPTIPFYFWRLWIMQNDIAVELTEDVGDDPTVPAMAFTIFAVGRGIGSVTSGEL